MNEHLTVKTMKARPVFYTLVYTELKEIAEAMGYNLLLHGSVNRDMDLVAIPWKDEVSTHLEVLKAFAKYPGTPELNESEHYMFSVLPGGRQSYVINLNRGKNGIDPQWYLDISFTPKFPAGTPRS
jgi:hypothetical protein